MTPQIPIPQDKIEAFCQKWKITEFSLFGSVLGEKFTAQSDIDVLVTFEANAKWTLMDMARMQDELEVVFGREVDLIERRAVEKSYNPYRRQSILSSTYSVYGS